MHIANDYGDNNNNNTHNINNIIVKKRPTYFRSIQFDFKWMHKEWLERLIRGSMQLVCSSPARMTDRKTKPNETMLIRQCDSHHCNHSTPGFLSVKSANEIQM